MFYHRASSWLPVWLWFGSLFLSRTIVFLDFWTLDNPSTPLYNTIIQDIDPNPTLWLSTCSREATCPSRRVASRILPSFVLSMLQAS
jgi:hypothetical protein